MSKSAKATIALMIVLVMGAALLSGCGESSSAGRIAVSEPARYAVEDASSVLSSELARLESLPTPDGVDEAVFAAMKAKLAAMLKGLGPERLVSTPPMTSRSCTPLLWDSDTDSLNWGYYCNGDYNQDSLVSVNDITPLGQNFLAEVPGDPNSLPAVVDGNGNGLIEIADITSIGQNFLARVTAYNVYVSDSQADYPSSAIDGNGDATLLGSVPFPATPPQGLRRRFSFAVSNAQPGMYYWVRPTDGRSEGTPSSLLNPSNELPVASLTADPLVGDVPMLVEFDASESYDPDGAIVKYEWDWDGELNGWQWFDSGTESVQQHLFNDVAENNTTLRITDNTGGTSSIAVQVWATAPGNDAPVAKLAADPVAGDPPLEVHFSAVGSYDIDGVIEDYQWDLDGDGSYSELGDETAARGKVEAAATFNELGNPAVSLRVIDDAGAYDSASVELDIGNYPPIAVLTADPYFGNEPLAVDFSAEESSDADGTIVNYEWDLNGDGQFGVEEDELSAAGSSTATSTYMLWGEYAAAVRVTDNEGAQATDSYLITACKAGWNIVTVDDSYLISLSMSIVDGHPAIAYIYSPDTGGIKLNYVRSATPTGTSRLDWVSKVLITDNVTGESTTVLGVIASNPAVAYSRNNALCYVWSKTPTGNERSDWSQEVVIINNDDSWPMACGQLLTVDGCPALPIECNYDQIWYARADTETGKGAEDWGELVPVEIDNCAHYPSMALVADHPAIAYTDIPNHRLVYVRSTSSDGMNAGDWSEKVAVYNGTEVSGISLNTIDEHPAVSWRRPRFVPSTDMDLIYQRSSTAFGNSNADWENLVKVSFGDTPCRCSQLLEIDGHPAIGFLDNGHVMPDEPYAWLTYVCADTANGMGRDDWSRKDVVDAESYFNSFYEAYTCYLLSMAIVNGQPAIAYKADGHLKYAYYNPITIQSQ